MSRVNRLILAAFVASAVSTAANATCPSWHTLTNGSTADATEVMDNFNVILNCPDFVGNVGVGTTSPLQRLVTQGQGVFLSDSTPPDSGNPAEGTGTHLGFYSTVGYGYLYAANNGVAMKPLILNTQQGGFAGNIGIGTTTPGTILDVESAIGLGGTSAANLTLVDTTSQATGHGGGILFDGAYTGTTQTVAAAIRAEKTNSTAGDFGFGLGFYTRVNGSSQTTENLVISSTGNVGIGTSSPVNKIDIRASTNGAAGIVVDNDSAGTAAYSALSLANSSLGNIAELVFTGPNHSAYWSEPNLLHLINRVGGISFNTNGYSDSNERVRITSSGNVGIGTTSPVQALEVVGTIRQTGCTTAGTLSANASGDIICSSDARLKNVLGSYTGGLAELSRITPKLFTYKPTKSDPIETFVHAGFVAQDVMAAIPQATALQRDGYYSLDTTAILAATVNSVKALKADNDQKAAKIAALEARLAKDEQELARIESALRLRTASAGHFGAAGLRPTLTGAQQ